MTLSERENKGSILIIGAGTFGLSTALELAQKGLSNVCCFDKYKVPSPIAAGNDSNKIFDYPYLAPSEEPSTSERLDLEARDEWKKNPIYELHYHPVGLIEAASSEKPLLDTIKRFQYLREAKIKDYRYIDTPEQFREYLPILKGELQGWRGFVLDQDNGWIHARNSLIDAYKEAKRLGVQFYFGEDGEIVDVEYGKNEVVSIIAKSGKKYTGEKYVMTLGASAVKILNFESQLEAKCFTLVHIKVTDEEAKDFKGLPVVFNSERGFFFEPDENNEIKICNEFPGYTNYIDKGESIPLHKMEIPLEAANDVRQFLKETMPQLANRPFVKTRICWCTDSPNRELILTTHPQFKNLIIGSGDSGRSFMLMPIIGKYISKPLIEGDETLLPQDRENWKWRPETSDSRDNKQGRYGGKGLVTDLLDVTEWISAENPNPHKLP